MQWDLMETLEIYINGVANASTETMQFGMQAVAVVSNRLTKGMILRRSQC